VEAGNKPQHTGMKFNPYTPHPASSNAAAAKEMQLPEDASRQHQTDSTLIKALEAGEFASIAELAEQEGIALSYMTRVLRIALLPPDALRGYWPGIGSQRCVSLSSYKPFLPSGVRKHGRDANGPKLPVSAHEELQCDLPTPAVQQWPQHLSIAYVGDADEADV
jgi:hypothetical protein